MSESNSILAYRIDDFCEAIGLGRTKVYDLIKQKKLKPIRVGGRTLIPRSEAERLLAEASADA